MPKVTLKNPTAMRTAKKQHTHRGTEGRGGGKRGRKQKAWPSIGGPPLNAKQMGTGKLEVSPGDGTRTERAIKTGFPGHNGTYQNTILPLSRTTPATTVAPRYKPVPKRRSASDEIWISFLNRPFKKITIPRKPWNGSEIRTLIACALGLPPPEIRVYLESRLVTSQKKLPIRQGAFLRIELGLVGGNGTPESKLTGGEEVDTGIAILKPKLVENYEPTATPCKRNMRGAFDPKHEIKSKSKTSISEETQPRYEWTLTRKTRNKRTHTENGNPEKARPHINPKPNTSLSLHPPLLLWRRRNASPALNKARTALRTKWAAMIRLAKASRIFKIGDASSMTIKRRLIAYLRNPVERADNPAENHPNLLSHPHGHRTDQPESPGLNPGLIEIAADLICISFSNEDGPIFDAIAN